MAIYKSAIKCIAKRTAYALTIEVVNGNQSLKFNPYLQNAVNNIIKEFKEVYIGDILAKTDNVKPDDFNITIKYSSTVAKVSIVSRCDKSARVIAEDIDWWMFPRLQCVLAANGCELTK